MITAAIAMSASPAPAGKSPWSEYKNSEGRVYWSHSVTKQSVWEKPDELKTPFEKAVSKTQWKQYTSKNRPYYVHSVTKETKWDLPQELLDLKEKVDQQEAAKEERARRVAAGERSPTPIRGSESPDIQATRENAVARYRSPTPERERTPLEVITMPPGGFLTHDKAEEGFIYLLKRERVDETWTWDQTMRQIIMDPLYKALGTLAEKKAAFEKVTTAGENCADEQYTQSIITDRQAAKEARLARLRPLLFKLFAQSPYIKSYSTIKTADQVFAKERHWREATAEERRLLVDEFVTDLRRREEVSKADITALTCRPPREIFVGETCRFSATCSNRSMSRYLRPGGRRTT